MKEQRTQALNVLWLIDLDYSTRGHHGATLRYLNYSRQLVAAGHRVYFIVEVQSETFERASEYLRELKANRTITDFFEISYRYPSWKRRLATLSVLPRVANLWCASEHRCIEDRVRNLGAELDVDVCLFSNRELFCLVPRMREYLPSIIDFGDCWTLYRAREIRLLWRNGRRAEAVRGVRYFVEWYLKERYYSRAAEANISVSPVDKRAFDRISGTAEKNYVLLNGVAAPEIRKGPKTPGRLIFSGNMDFPPNYQSAIWFIDEVLPKVREAHPAAHAIIAGANPVPELVARANDYVRVTGFVEDMAGEIAQSALYVAPMISGGGFKNKVVEALISRTYVAATPIAVEFLRPETARMLMVAEDADGLAARIIEYLSHPVRYESRLNELHAMVAQEFSWAHRTEELLAIIGRVLPVAGRVQQRAPEDVAALR